MKQKFVVVFTLVALVAAAFAFLPTPRIASADCITQSGDGDADVWIGPFSMPAGSWVMVTMTAGVAPVQPLAVSAQASYGGTAIGLLIGGALSDASVQYVAEHTITFEFDEATTNIQLILDWQVNGDPANTYVVTSSDCGGCDTLIPIPASAVGGKFTENSELYWMPGEVVAPAIVMEIGKNVRVIGLDASGDYYKILYGCTFAWVRAGTIGPNPESPWNSAPLPVDIVD